MWNSACRWARPRLSLLAGGELSGTDRRKAERHLIHCAECRGYLESVRESLSALSFLASEPTTSADAPSLWPSLARQIREEKHTEPMFAGSLRPVWAGLALAASVLVVAGTTVWSLSGGPKLSNRGSVAAKPIKPAPSAVKPGPTIAEANPNSTVADNSSSHRAEGEPSVASPSPTHVRKESGVGVGRIGVEPTQ